MAEPLVEPDDTPGTVVDRFVGFGHALRDAGLPVGSDDVLTFCASLAVLRPGDPVDVYWAGRTTLVHRRDHLPVYDEEFRRYFLHHPPPPIGETVPEQPVPQGTSGTLQVPDSEPGEHDGDERPMVLGLQASAVEIERTKRFADCTPAELRALRRIMASVRLQPPMRRTRRRAPDRRGPLIDIRRMARAEMQVGEASSGLLRLDRKHRARPVVLLLDVSGSMADHSRNLLQFGYSMRRAAQKVEVFCFGTRLTRITPTLDRRDPDDAMKLAAARVLDWDGGTRIGASVDAFIRGWGRRGVSRAATVVICSDGLDRGDPRVLVEAMERLARLSHRIVWVNPLHEEGSPSTSVGMIAAQPFIDELVSGRDLAGLEHFAERLAHVG